MNTTFAKVAAAACLTAVFAAATACGTEDGSSSTTDAATSGVKAGRTSADLLGAAKARHDARLRAEHQRSARAERADAMRWGHGQLAHHTQR
jgi:hypothetical protein